MTTRREFVTGTAMAAAATPAFARTQKKRAPQKKMLIVNALGDLDNPNIALTQPQADNPVDLDKLDIDDRTLRDAHASGLSAVNVTLGYVAGPMSRSNTPSAPSARGTSSSAPIPTT